MRDMAHPVGSLALLWEVFNHDFSQHPEDRSLSDDVLASMIGLRGFLDLVISLSGRKNPTVNDFIRYSGCGSLDQLPVFAGTPSQVADGMEEWFTGGACDGFVLAATHMPGAYDDFVRMVVAELQRRNLFQREYWGSTLRESLGLTGHTGLPR